MTPEARLAFVIFFFAVWCFLGLIAWAIAAVVARGRGALPTLPLALAGAAAAGVAVPLVGLDDFTGFVISLATAFLAGAIASAAGIRLARRLWPTRRDNRVQLPVRGPTAGEGSATASDVPPSNTL